MKYSAKIMTFVMALSVTTSMESYAQTSPAATPDQQQPQVKQQPQAKQQQDKHPKAKGAAAGAVVGAASGNAAKGAVIGAGHSRRQERRGNR